MKYVTIWYKWIDKKILLVIVIVINIYNHNQNQKKDNESTINRAWP